MANHTINKLLDRFKPYPRIRGACARCGKCCQSLLLTWKKEVVTTTKQYEKLLRWNPVVYDRFVPDAEQVDGEPMRFSCKYQNEDNGCSVHKARPDICKTYPHHSIFKLGAELEEGCGYRVIHKGSFGDVLEKKMKK